MDFERLTTTQDMFLERVGITNSFNDDNEFRFEPFFVSKYILKIKSNPTLMYRKSMVSNLHMSRRRSYIS